MNTTSKLYETLEKKLVKVNNPNAYIADTAMGLKILVHGCDRCERGADTDIINHYNCFGSTHHSDHCTMNSCF